VATVVVLVLLAGAVFGEVIRVWFTSLLEHLSIVSPGA